MRANYENIPEQYTEYARKVLSGEILAGSNIKLVAQRFLDFLKRDDVYFDTDRADKPVTFIAKLRHTEAPFTGKPFILEPWQKFVTYCMFGFFWKKNERRVCRSAYIQIARKCGKSSFAAALSLYGLIADGEIGAQIYFCSPSTSQTQQDFQYCTNYAESINKGSILTCLQNRIKFSPTKSIIKCLSPKAKIGDGFNPYFAIIDEYHAMEDNKLAAVMESGMGMRRNPMMIYITTAGFNLDGPCKEFRDLSIEILRGLKTDDSVWPFIYEIDEGDDWKDPLVWPKAVPSMPDVVLPEFIEGRVLKAKNNPNEEVDVRTKNINQWVSSSTVWISDEKVAAMCEEVPLDVFKDEVVYGSIDLGYTSDLTAYTIMAPPNEYREFHPDKFIFKTFFYLPDKCLTESKNWLRYRNWAEHKHLIVTPDDMTDYQYILDDVLSHLDLFKLQNLSYDAYQAVFFIIKAEQAGIPCAAFSQNLGNFNKVILDFELIVGQNKVVIDNNPIIRWNFNNVDMFYNTTGLKKPKKTKDPQKKIDGVITILQSFGNWLADGGEADLTFTS